MGKNMRICMYCGQHLKHANLDAFHKKCKEIYTRKVEGALASSLVFPEIKVYRNGTIVRVKICRACSRPITEREIIAVESYLKENEINSKPKACLKCTKMERGK